MGKKISVGPKPVVRADDAESKDRPGFAHGRTVEIITSGNMMNGVVKTMEVKDSLIDPEESSVSFGETNAENSPAHAEAVMASTILFIDQAERDILALGDHVNGIVSLALPHLGQSRLPKALQLFVAMERLKKASASACSTMLENLGPIERTFFQRFLDEGVDKITVAGATVFPRADVYPTAKADAVAEGPDGQMLQGREAMVAVIERDEGMSHLIKKDVNLNSLRSFITTNFTELDDAGKPVLSDELAAVIDFNVKHSLGMRKA